MCRCMSDPLDQNFFLDSSVRRPLSTTVQYMSPITRSTGFAEGLYDDTELDSGTIKDKDAKLSYLKKIVDCVGACCGEKLDVRGAKVRGASL